MTTQELRELDAWIAGHVMGYMVKKQRLCASEGRKFYDKNSQRLEWWADDFGPTHTYFQPSTKSHDAMDVLKKCAEKARIVDSHICIGNDNKQWEIWLNDNDGSQWHGEGETLELAIAKFSKALFSQTTK